MCKVKLNISHADIFLAVFGSFWQQPAMQCTLVRFVQILSGVNPQKDFFLNLMKMITLLHFNCQNMISNRTCEFEIQVLAGANTKVLFTDHYT